MIKLIHEDKKKSAFLEYMLFQEADGERPSNMKVIDLKASDRRRQDFTKGADMSDDEENSAPDVEAPDEPETDDDTDFGDDDGGDNTADTPDTEAPDEPETDDDTDFGDDDGGDDTADTPDDGGGDAEGNDNGGDADAPDAPDTGDDTDFSDDGGGDDTDVPADNDGGDAGGDDGAEDQNTVEQLYKYNLYQKFQKIYINLGSYLDELNSIISDDAEINKEYKELTSKLDSIKTLMKDYMIMKFDKCSYMKSMLFYQRVMTSISLILKTLKKLRSKEKDIKT